MRNGNLVLFVLVSWLFIVSPARICPAKEESKTFVAYSMKVAQARAEEAIKGGEDLRKKQPDLYYLGGITKPWAVALDTKGGDWILVGERDPKCSVLTLDDWVVALRARFIHAEKDPGVTIDPRPCDECQKAGKTEACKHSTRQDVRFFGGIEDTHFGQVCFEADWLMKKIGLGLERLPVPGLKTYYDLSVEQARAARAVNTRVGCRFWFYPIVNRVNVFPDVVLLEQFQMGVFTEVLHAEVDGKAVTDLESFEHYPSEEFSRSLSDNYDAAAEARDVFETLRGLTRLAALAKGLTHVSVKPHSNFYLTVYPMENLQTEKEVGVLKVDNRGIGIEISGGVSLTALAMELKGGDTRALRNMILKARPSSQALVWGFVAETSDGNMTTIRIPTELADPHGIASLFAQAAFLQRKERHDAAIECYDHLLELAPDLAEGYLGRAVCHAMGKEDYETAIADLNRVLLLDSDSCRAHLLRGLCYARGAHDYDRAIRDYGRSLELNPTLAVVYELRGEVHAAMRDYERAVSDYDKAIQLDAVPINAHYNKALAYEKARQFQKAIDAYGTCINFLGKRGSETLDVDLALAYIGRARCYRGLGSLVAASSEYQKAASVSGSHLEALYEEAEMWEEGSYPREAIRAYARFAEVAGPQKRYAMQVLKAQARMEAIRNQYFGLLF